MWILINMVDTVYEKFAWCVLAALISINWAQLLISAVEAYPTVFVFCSSQICGRLLVFCTKDALKQPIVATFISSQARLLLNGTHKSNPFTRYKSLMPISYRCIQFTFFHTASGWWHIGHWEIVYTLSTSFADTATNLNPRENLMIITFGHWCMYQTIGRGIGWLVTKLTIENWKIWKCMIMNTRTIQRRRIEAKATPHP